MKRFHVHIGVDDLDFLQDLAFGSLGLAELETPVPVDRRISAADHAHEDVRGRKQALDAGRGLVQQEGLEDGARVLQVQVVARHLDHPGLLGEALVDRPRFRRGRIEPLRLRQAKA